MQELPPTWLGYDYAGGYSRPIGIHDSSVNSLSSGTADGSSALLLLDIGQSIFRAANAQTVHVSITMHDPIANVFSVIRGLVHSIEPSWTSVELCFSKHNSKGNVWVAEITGLYEERSRSFTSCCPGSN